MASLRIRDLDDETYERLRERAASHGLSVEEEARQILRLAMAPPERLRDYFLAVFGPENGVDMELQPARAQSRWAWATDAPRRCERRRRADAACAGSRVVTCPWAGGEAPLVAWRSLKSETCFPTSFKVLAVAPRPNPGGRPRSGSR